MADVGTGNIFHVIHVSETLEPLDATAFRVESLPAAEKAPGGKGASESSAATTTRSWPTRRRLSARRSASPHGTCRETRGIDRR
jgi:hypothetical protein